MALKIILVRLKLILVRLKLILVPLKLILVPLKFFLVPLKLFLVPLILFLVPLKIQTFEPTGTPYYTTFNFQLNSGNAEKAALKSRIYFSLRARVPGKFCKVFELISSVKLVSNYLI